jgi:hypothetical protein
LKAALIQVSDYRLLGASGFVDSLLLVTQITLTKCEVGKAKF